MTTKMDPVAVARAVDDEPMRLREWGTDRTHALPPARAGEWVIGAGADCWLQVHDPTQSVSRRHAAIAREGGRWQIRDAQSKNGLWIDGARTAAAELVPGAEIGLGRHRLVVESPRTVRQRALLARILGWDPARAPVVDRALRAVRSFVAMRLPLSLTGADHLVRIARRIHREVVGAARPLVVSRTRAGADENARALLSAEDGTLCLVGQRLFDDLRRVRELAPEHPPRSRILICTRRGEQLASIEVPALALRRDERARIVDEYAADAITELGARADCFTPADRAMVLHGALSTLGEIELTTRRVVALREHGEVSGAAARLGIPDAALARWLARRRLR